MKRISLIFLMAFLLMMVVGNSVATNTAGTFAKIQSNGGEFMAYEHSPPGEVSVVNTITANCVSTAPCCNMMNPAIANTPTENVDQNEEVVNTITGAKERAGPAVADHCLYMGMYNPATSYSSPMVYSNEFGTAIYSYSDATWTNDRASPANFSMWSQDGQMNVANFQCVTNTTRNTDVVNMEEAAVPARRLAIYNVSGLTTNEASPAGEAPILTQEVYCPNIGEKNAYGMDNSALSYQTTGTAGGIPTSIAQKRVNGADYPNPFNQNMAAVNEARRYPNPFA